MPTSQSNWYTFELGIELVFEMQGYTHLSATSAQRLFVDRRGSTAPIGVVARSLVEGAGREVERAFFADLADAYEACLLQAGSVSLG